MELRDLFPIGCLVHIKGTDIAGKVDQILVEGSPASVQYKIVYYVGSEQKLIWVRWTDVETKSTDRVHFGFMSVRQYMDSQGITKY